MWDTECTCFWHPAGRQGSNYRRVADVADEVPFVTALAVAFDKGATTKDRDGRWILQQLDGEDVKPCVTIQQLGAISFKVLDSSL